MDESSGCEPQTLRSFRGTLPALLHLPHKMAFEILYSGVVHVIFCTIPRQIGENNHDRFVVRVIALNRLSAQEQALVTVNKLDNIWHATVGDLLRSEPKRFTLAGPRHEGTYGPSAAEILVRRGHDSLSPVCDGVKRIQIAVRELPRPGRLFEILEEEEISGLC